MKVVNNFQSDDKNICKIARSVIATLVADHLCSHMERGLQEPLACSGDEMYYGSVCVESAAFQDNVSQPSTDLITAQAGMIRLAVVLEERGLDAHE